MRKIKFIGQTSSTYFLGKGRGKDKKKRKRRVMNALKGAGLGLLGGAGGIGIAELKEKLGKKAIKAVGAKAMSSGTKLRAIGAALGVTTLGGAALGNTVVDKKPKLVSPLERYKIYKEKQNSKKASSLAVTIPLVTAGTITGASKFNKKLGILGASNLGMNSGLGAYTGGMTAAGIGLQADKQITKEKARYKKEGARTRLGKIANDAKIGIKSTAGILAANQAITQSVKSFAKRNGLPIKTKLLGAVGAGLGGAIYGGVKGTAIGAGIGSGVGTVRGFVQPNKKKKDKK